MTGDNANADVSIVHGNSGEPYKGKSDSDFIPLAQDSFHRVDDLKASNRKKVIINTDPGVDDAMAIFMAFQSPELEILGFCTTFGNTTTELATLNSLILCEMAGQAKLPVASGDDLPLDGSPVRAADFVHGADGLGNTYPVPSTEVAISQSATDFLIQTVSANPGEVTIVSLGPLTNLARAIQKDSKFASQVAEIWILGGSFFASGNVNTAAEANVFGDPEAADVVFTSGANIVAVGLNVTTRSILTEEDLVQIRDSKGKYGKYVYSISRFYKEWHLKSDALDGIYLHDPSCMAGLLDPTLFTYRTGAVRVETLGICRGQTLMDLGLKNWNGSNPWVGQPKVKVALGVDNDRMVAFVKEILSRP